jgi:guanine nucleotide-binding protein G(i) subunit alpha
MACCTSSQNAELSRKTATIDEKLRQDKLKKRDEVKMLLLGAGEAGKSTILKRTYFEKLGRGLMV